MYQFSRQFMKFPELLKCWPPKPPWGGVCILIFWAVHEISRTFEFLTPKTPLGPPWGGVGQFFLGESQSHIYPNISTLPRICERDGGNEHIYF